MSVKNYTPDEAREIAAEAYETYFRAPDDPEFFELLDKSVKHRFIEVVEKGDETDAFHAAVVKLIEEQTAETEDLATEEQLRKSLEEKSIPALKTLAKDELKLEIPKEITKKSDILDFIVKHIGTREVVEEIENSGGTLSQKSDNEQPS